MRSLRPVSGPPAKLVIAPAHAAPAAAQAARSLAGTGPGRRPSTRTRPGSSRRAGTPPWPRTRCYTSCRFCRRRGRSSGGNPSSGWECRCTCPGSSRRAGIRARPRTRCRTSGRPCRRRACTPRCTPWSGPACTRGATAAAWAAAAKAAAAVTTAATTVATAAAATRAEIHCRRWPRAPRDRA
eukprot:scaffold2878_cov73-Phaeocystis_antarctica.AAC.6